MERRTFFTGVAISSLVATGTAVSSAGAAGEVAFATLNEFGALGDGKSDDSDSIQRAFDACSDGRLLLVPQGRFRITKRLHARGLLNLAGFGAAASRFEVAAGAGISYQGRATDDFASDQITLRSIGFRCEGAPAATSADAIIDIRFDRTQGGTACGAILEDVEIVAASESVSFACAVRFTDASNLRIDGVRIRGGRDARGASIGIDIAGNASPVDLLISKVSAYFLHRAINFGGTVEGIYIEQSVLVAVDHGIYGVTPDVNPLLFVHNCHINAFVSCVSITNIVQFDISHNLFYCSKPRTPLPPAIAKSGFVAVAIALNGQVGLTSRLTSNTIIGTTPIDMPKNGVYVDGQSAEFSLSIEGNELVGWDTAVLLGRGARGVVVAASNRFRSNATAALDLANANVVADRRIEPEGFVRGDDGLETKWGTSDVELDSSGAGRIALPSAFASKVVFGLCTVADAASSVRVVADVAASTKDAIAVRSAPAAHSRTLAVQWIAIGC
jgi:hypothetical protein